MTDDVMQAAMTTWAAKDLPARLLAGQVAKLLNCTRFPNSMRLASNSLFGSIAD